jgi:hypothetical protein
MTALVLFASPLTLLAQVSKEEVRRLLDAHVSEQTIMSYVQRNGPMDALSVEDLGDLKNAGASDTLLQALIQAQTAYSTKPPSTDSTGSYTESSTVIYDSPQYYYPSTAYPAYSYSYPAPYYYSYYPYSYSYPYRYYSSYPYRYYPNRYPTYHGGHSYPYNYSSSGYHGHSGYYGTSHPTTVTNPRYPQSGGVNVYRQSPQPRTVAPQSSTPRPQAPSPAGPRGGGGGVPRR